MPAEPISVVLLVCERVIQDFEDRVATIVRIVDLFRVAESTVPPEQRPVGMQVFLSLRFPHDDDGTHTVALHLERPTGESALIAETPPTRLEAAERALDAPKGMSLVAKVGVIPKVMGTHYFKVSLDGEEVARTPFTLTPAPTKDGVPRSQMSQE
jgi:hypothetical protein